MRHGERNGAERIAEMKLLSRTDKRHEVKLYKEVQRCMKDGRCEKGGRKGERPAKNHLEWERCGVRKPTKNTNYQAVVLVVLLVVVVFHY